MGYSQATVSTEVEGAERPDVGFIAAVGVYVGIGVAAAAAALAVAAGVSVATILGSLSTAFTVGLVGGALGARRSVGLAERIGRGPPWLAAPFCLPAGFVVATVAVLFTPVADAAAIGTGAGALGTGFLALGLAGMGRTRYARAMVSGEPLATTDWVRTNQPLYWFGWGAGLLVLGVLPGLFTDGSFIQRGSFHLLLMGAMFCLMGWSVRSSLAGDETADSSRRFLPDRARRSVFGMELSQEFTADIDSVGTHELEVYPEGVVRTQPMQRRFLPWSAIEEVALTDEELRLERAGWRDWRCHRAVIDDPDELVETIEVARRDADGTGQAPDRGSRMTT